MKNKKAALFSMLFICPSIRAQSATARVEMPLPNASIPQIVMAIEDEIYDYKQEKYFTNIGSTGAINDSTEVPVFISKSVSADNVGWVLYKDMPYGEVLRRFLIRKDGLVVLYGDPELHFPAEQPDTNTLYLPEEDVCKFIMGALKSHFSVNPKVPHERILDAEKRQIIRTRYSYSKDHQLSKH